MLAVLGALLAVAASAPAAGAADRGRYDVEPGHLTRFELRGTNGYKISVSINDRGYITVKTEKGAALAQYVTPGRISGLGGSATLPGLGRVSFDFTPTGPVRRRPGDPSCGGDTFVREGVARGVFRFRGEGGYTRARTHRARAELISWPRQSCLYPKDSARRDRVGKLTAYDFGQRFTVFTATRFSPRSRPLARRIRFSAVMLTERPRLSVFRFVAATAGPASFRVPEPQTAPENISITPPRPFTGTGELRRTPESTFVWKGSLRVAFPGTEPIKLVGPKFVVEYCALRGCAERFPPGSPFGL